MRAPAWIVAGFALGCGYRDEAQGPDATIATATPTATPTAIATPTATPACPPGMLHVATSFCPEVERKCVDLEHDDFNHLDICHAFEPKQRCRAVERAMDFCIDAYEYPNEKGAHPIWMRTWFEAQATCESNGKRLCWASEWTAACEGAEHTPFPYGWERNHDACNVDNFFINPRKPGPRAQFLFYSKNRDVADRELLRLDESVPSGSMDRCKSSFGVYDLTGNLDEWVTSDQPPREKSKWSGLKGGAWGHVRSQCRPMTTSHEPEFSYYFVGFRCCADAAGAAPWTPAPGAEPPPAVEPHDFAQDRIPAGAGAGPTTKKFSRTGKRE